MNSNPGEKKFHRGFSFLKNADADKTKLKCKHPLGTYSIDVKCNIIRQNSTAPSLK